MDLPEGGLVGRCAGDLARAVSATVSCAALYSIQTAQHDNSARNLQQPERCRLNAEIA